MLFPIALIYATYYNVVYITIAVPLILETVYIIIAKAQNLLDICSWH